MTRTALILAKTASLTFLAALLWATALVAIRISGIGGLDIAGTGSSEFIAAAREHAKDHRGNLSLILIEDGQVSGTLNTSIGRPVSSDTLFQMASVSKWVTAWGVMLLVERRKIELDVPVSRYLKRWQLPPGSYSNDQVTVRTLLSHTAGLGDQLGYCGFAPGIPIQTLEASLTKAADACPLRTGVTRTDNTAGGWEYSGGGYTILQLLIEDVSGEPFADFMRREVLLPLGMIRSTFRTGAEGSADLATSFDSDGKVAPDYRFTAAAAASLYSSANDQARFALAHFPGRSGEVAGRGVLSPDTLDRMRQPQARLLGAPHWGLGVQLFAPSAGAAYIFGHNGGNNPAIVNSVRLDPASGDGIVLLSSGGEGVAHDLIGKWTALRRSSINAAVVLSTAQSMVMWIGGGTALILLLGLMAAIRAIRQNQIRAVPQPAG